MSIGASKRRGASIPRRFTMFWVRHLQQGTASLGELWRTPTSSMLTIAVIGLCLALPAIFHIAVKNLQSVLPDWQDNAQITLFLEQQISEADRQKLVTKVESLRQVASVELINKDQGFEEFKVYSGFGEALDLLDENPLPDVLLVTPASTLIGLEPVAALRKTLEGYNGVAQAKLDAEWLERLAGILSMIGRSIQLLIILLLSSVLLIVGNTIRLNILSQRDEIEIMKLVGATNAFIQRPFLYTGFWFGFIGGLLAWLLSNITMLWLEPTLAELTQTDHAPYHLIGLTADEFGILMAVACSLGLLASGFSVARHINKIEPS